MDDNVRNIIILFFIGLGRFFFGKCIDKYKERKKRKNKSDGETQTTPTIEGSNKKSSKRNKRRKNSNAF